MNHSCILQIIIIMHMYAEYMTDIASNVSCIIRNEASGSYIIVSNEL